MVPSPCHDDVDVSLVVGTSHQHRDPHGPHREGYKHKHTQTHTDTHSGTSGPERLSVRSDFRETQENF